MGVIWTSYSYIGIINPWDTVTSQNQSTEYKHTSLPIYFNLAHADISISEQKRERDQQASNIKIFLSLARMDFVI